MLWALFCGKWKTRIICELGHCNHLRYGELKVKIQDVSDAALADSLKELQQAGIINRKQFNEMPIRVEYSLTSEGKRLLPIFIQITSWSVDNSQIDDYK